MVAPNSDRTCRPRSTAKADREFVDNLKDLKDYVAIHGEHPTQHTKFRGKKLGQWRSRQRGNYRKNKLAAVRVALLEQVDGWTWEGSEATWAANLALLKQFVEEMGKLPAKKDVYRGVELGKWCGTQRASYNGTGHAPLSAERQAALEEVPGWVWRQPSVWEERLALLQQFVAEHGRQPAKREEYKGVKLGVWCMNQRIGKKNGAAASTQQRQQQLEQVPGWYWEKQDPWQRWLELLHAFVTQHGRLPLAVEAYQGQMLGTWCARQRADARKGKLSDEQQAALDAVPGWQQWDWWQWLHLLQQYMEEHGELPARVTVYQGMKLGAWCCNQRVKRKAALLSQQQREALEAVPLWDWSPPTGRRGHFENWLALLRRFVQLHGRLPTQSEQMEGRALGMWCNNQRQAQRKGRLAADKQAALAAVDGWWWTSGQVLHATVC